MTHSYSVADIEKMDDNTLWEKVIKPRTYERGLILEDRDLGISMFRLFPESMLAHLGLKFDEEGYDREGYDAKGFNKDGIHRATGTRYNRGGRDKKGRYNIHFDDEKHGLISYIKELYPDETI